MAGFRVKLLSPARPVADTEAAGISLPSMVGYMEMLPGHAPFISELECGELVLKKQNNDELKYFVSGGYFEADNEGVRILAETVEAPAEIDKDRASKSGQRASERLSKVDSSIDIDRALRSLKRSQERVAMADRI